MASFEWGIAGRYLWAQKNKLSSGLIALFSFAGVFIGTSLLIFVFAASNGFEREVKNQLIGKDAHFEVNQFYNEPIFGFDSILAKVEKIPGVVAASPYVMSQAVFAKTKNFSGGVVFGIDPEKSQNVITLKQNLNSGEYRFDSLLDEKGTYRDGIIMGYALAARLGIFVGEKCVLYVFGEGADITTTFTPKAKIFVLAGTFESGMYQYDESLAYVKLAAAQEAFDMGNSVTGIHGKVKDPMKSGDVSKTLQEQLGYPFSSIDWREKNKILIKWMEYEKILFGVALGVIIIIAAFNIISSLVMNVNDKRREIGILRAMGATRKNIRRIFIYEGMLIGIVGSITGALFGLLACYIQMKYGLITLPGDVYFVTVLPTVPRMGDVVLVVIVTNILCFLATLVPSLIAARLNLIEAIRYE